MNRQITLDQQYALKTAAARLERHFAGDAAVAWSGGSEPGIPETLDR